jgi:hypothetical protein
MGKMAKLAEVLATKALELRKVAQSLQPFEELHRYAVELDRCIGYLKDVLEEKSMNIKIMQGHVVVLDHSGNTVLVVGIKPNENIDEAMKKLFNDESIVGRLAENCINIMTTLNDQLAAMIRDTIIRYSDP